MDDADVFDVDQSLRDSVTGLVSALGGIDRADPAAPNYVLGDDALGCLRDLKKWIKFYAAAGKLDALRCIADTNLVALDLCSILASFREGHEADSAQARLALNCRNSPAVTVYILKVLTLCSRATRAVDMASRARSPSCRRPRSAVIRNTHQICADRIQKCHPTSSSGIQHPPTRRPNRSSLNVNPAPRQA